MKVEPSVQLECLGNETVLTWCGELPEQWVRGHQELGVGVFLVLCGRDSE